MWRDIIPCVKGTLRKHLRWVKTTMTMTTECLVFTIFNQRVCMPISAVQGIQPLHCTIPVPCTERWVLGLGLKDNRVFTVVCPVPQQEGIKTQMLEEKMLLSRSCGAGFQP